MAIATFDTLKFANTLKAAGVPDKQAEAQAVAFAEVFQVNFRDLVTKADLDQAVKELRREIADLGDELKREIADARDEFAQKLKDVEQKLTLQYARLTGDMLLLKWMLGVTLTAVVGLVVRLVFFKIQ